jgi:putative ABC transport system permease protein
LYSSVSPTYFDVLHVSLLRGRVFTDEDKAESSRVVIINENFARQNFSGADPVGRHLAILGPAVPGQPKPGIVQIVGMTANVHAVGLDEVPFAEMYFPYLQEPVRDVYVALRMVSGAPANEGLLRSAVSAIDKDAPVSEIKTMKARVSESLGENRFNMILIGTTALTAMLLAALGTYGIIALYVTQRTREIGIRMALGAQRRNVLQLVLGQSAKLAMIGMGIGLAAALVLGELLRGSLYLVPGVHNGLLYGVTPRDPLTFVAVVIILGCSAAVASYLPSRRAAHVEPMVALRHE